MVSHSSPHWVSFPPLRDYSITPFLIIFPLLHQSGLTFPPQGGVTDIGNNYSQFIISPNYYLFFCAFLTKSLSAFSWTATLWNPSHHSHRSFSTEKHSVILQMCLSYTIKKNWKKPATEKAAQTTEKQHELFLNSGIS